MTETPTHLSALSETSSGGVLDCIVELAGNEEPLADLLIEFYSSNSKAGSEPFTLIKRAYYFAKEHHKGQTRKSGAPFLIHCVEVARLLVQLGLDDTTVAAGLLHDVVEDTPATHEEVAKQFGEEIAELIAGVTKIDQITDKNPQVSQLETYVKMLLSAAKDGRVIPIKLADRLHNMRTLQHLPPQSRERKARETLDLYAPLANLFGMALLRWQLEDQSLKFLEPKIYQELRDKVAMTLEEREAYLEKFKVPIEKHLNEEGIKAEFTSRPKNFYSIYNKMKKRGKPFEEIYDLLAIRIITGTRNQCYAILNSIHDIYKAINTKNYILTPKGNGYQSLHTSVVGPQGQYVEVQIRTKEMHQTAEIGIAAHWRYKSNDAGSSDFDQHASWIRQAADAKDLPEFLENVSTRIASLDQILVITPKGYIYELPKGSTPLDLAFAVHTDIGIHCVKAKVNGRDTPLGATLNSGEAVDIVTDPQQTPQLSWLDQAKTDKALEAIRHWLRKKEYDDIVRSGKKVLHRGLRTADLPDLNAVAQKFGLRGTEQLYVALGKGHLSIGKVISRIDQPKPTFPVQLSIRSWDRKNLLGDIATMIGETGFNIRDSTTRIEDHIAVMNFWIDVVDNQQLRQIMDRIERIDGVLEVLCVDDPANS